MFSSKYNQGVPSRFHYVLCLNMFQTVSNWGWFNSRGGYFPLYVIVWRNADAGRRNNMIYYNDIT